VTQSPTVDQLQAALAQLQRQNDQLQAAVSQLQNEQALQTQALRRTLEGNLDGPDGAAADVVALEGGQTSITVAPFAFGE